MNALDQPLFTPAPQDVARSNMDHFRRTVEARYGRALPDYATLHRWSIEEREEFWEAVWDYCGVIGDKGARVLIDGDKMPGARFFPDARLNFAENLLRRRDDHEALVFVNEQGARRSLSHRDLYDGVSRLRQYLAAHGVGAGDRVAAIMPNMPETIIAMLATSSLGAVWSSASPDFGPAAIIDRFGQIEPKILFCVDGYFYNGKSHDGLGRAMAVADAVPSIAAIVMTPFAGTNAAPDARVALWDAALAPYAPELIDFPQLPFDHPLYVLYSSGTTGKPKCIVHRAGGAILKHLQEHQHHGDIKPNDRFFYYTTCGWMMWNWLVSGLASGATLILYDGSPFYPNAEILFDLAERERITHFGVSAKYIDALMKAGARPRDRYALNALRVIFSTGSPLVPTGFDYVYDAIKPTVRLSSISGGTDLMGCFLGGNPMLPVWRGELTSAFLGMDVAAVDDAGRALPPGEKGELVCRRAFPTMPLGFWNDADGAAYARAYFARFENMWHHGDFLEATFHGGWIIYGRSDAVLNPGGVRIGTAEITRIVDRIDDIAESVVVGQDWDGDVRVILFVRLREGRALDDALKNKIKSEIRANATPRHVPAKIISIADIPRTMNGKIAELAVREVIHGRPVKNRDALLNPDALGLYADLPELRDA